MSSGGEHPPRDISSSQTGHCYGGIDGLLRSAGGYDLIHPWYIVAAVEMMRNPTEGGVHCEMRN
eukprot:gene26221-biopygen15026